MEDKCVCCGSVVPEGSQVCPNCQVSSAPEWMARKLKECKKVNKKVNKKEMIVEITLDSGAIMPTLAHGSDVGFDLYSREDAVIYQNGSGRFDTGVHIKIPENVCGLLVSKSGLDHKDNIQSTGLIDPDYVGSIWVKLYNHGPRAVEIKKGQKISQLLFLPVIKPKFLLVDCLEETERGTGGFGSSGKF